MKNKQSHQQESHIPLKLSAPAHRALTAAGVRELKQLTQFSEAEFLQLHGMGKNALGQLRQAIVEHGLSLRKEQKQRSSLHKTIRAQLDNIRSEDGQLQNKAYLYLMEKTEKPVSWAYEAWDELVDGLTHKDNHVRAVAAQVLANLAKSDPKGRMFKDFDKLLAVTKDERFVGVWRK